MRQMYIIGNWKMNLNLQDASHFFKQFNMKGNFFIAPQAPYLYPLSQIDSPIKLVSQNIAQTLFGAHTGEISPQALKDCKVEHTLIGHSERRSIYDESDSLLNTKVKNALKHNITPILCVGETLEQREADQTMQVVSEQLKLALKDVSINSSQNMIVAYEPVWAIGTGKTATSDQAQEVHKGIRNLLNELFGEHGKNTSILYGGSVKPSNITELLIQEDIDGALVGGASLTLADYNALCEAIS